MGKLVVFEGVDGSGKNTQLELLTRRLEEKGIKFKTIAFPRHGNPAACFIDKYLQPSHPYGEPKTIPAEVASMFYALDRYDASFEMKKWLEESDFVIADRYLGSNIGHQGGKIKDETKRKKYVDWLYTLEFNTLKIPKPDLTIVFYLPAEIAIKRIEKKQNRNYIQDGSNKDAHESDIEHLRNAGDAYKWAARTYPNFIIIDCCDKNKELTPEEIHEKVWQVFQKQYDI
ncbi:MAG: hypothetical protein A3H06_00630 [Candidatus Colwellbacteria bacterium RIFCSPLOWO2_12_FULL_44_13]|uniref:Thymidylate kinase n=2 Tax=Candidatus Colwelliibacteriota TaxID=1817904 RepID=A0A1G1ZAT4_9BACT|nr:MAG: hypothetical protein A3H06_00630 [Candidatus Colwellbacteria bacterium RIFCSPLOWO2_12_FULL_44_13]